MLLLPMLAFSYWRACQRTADAQGCRTLQFARADKGNSLFNHVFKKVSAPDFVNCGIQCFIESKCISVNLGDTADSKGMRACELSDSDHILDPSCLQPRPGYSYHPIKNNDCEHASCPVNTTCKPKLLITGGYECACKPGNYCKRDGRWSKWSAWSTCSTSDFTGRKTRTRTCTNPSPLGTGTPCSGSREQTLDCYMRVHVRSEAADDPGKTGRYGTAILQVNGQEYSPKNRGHNIAVFHMNGTFHSKNSFDTPVEQNAGVQMANYLDALPDSTMVLIAVQDDSNHQNKRYTEPASDALNRTQAKDPLVPAQRASWCLIGHRGGPKPWVRQNGAARHSGPSSLTANIETEACLECD